MVMKKNWLYLIVYITVLLLSCGGGGKPVQPEHLTSGMKQIQKGNEFYQMGCYARSLEHYFRAHEQFSASDQPNGVAMSLNNIGNIYRMTGDTTSALAYFDAAYNIYDMLKDYSGAIQVLSNKAAALLDTDDLAHAGSCLEKARDLASGHHIEFNTLRRNEAILHMKKKEYPEAEDILNALLEKTESTNSAEASSIHAAMGHLLMDIHQYRKAIGFLEKSLYYDRQSGFHKGLADTLAAIGAAHQELEEYPAACDYFQRSIKIYALIGDSRKVNDLMQRLNETALKADLDTTITRHFVDLWLAGEAESLCE